MIEGMYITGDNNLVHNSSSHDINSLRRWHGNPTSLRAMFWSRDVCHGRLLLHGQHLFRSQPVCAVDRILLPGKITCSLANSTNIKVNQVIRQKGFLNSI